MEAARALDAPTHGDDDPLTPGIEAVFEKVVEEEELAARSGES